MKKILSVFLALLLMLSLCVPAFAGDVAFPPYGSDIPVITIYGDGEPIYLKNDDGSDGKKVFHFADMGSMFSDTEDGALGDAVMNILYPFLLEGVTTDNWDNYYDALYNEIGEIFEDARYGANGEKCNNTNISNWCLDKMYSDMNNYNYKNTYNNRDYVFQYDWRQDPMIVATELHEYIESVKRMTGRDEVAIIAKCLGTSVVTSYLKMYGTDSVRGVSYAASISNGAEIISDAISGKFNFDGNAIARILDDLKMSQRLDLDNFIMSSIRLLDNAGVLDSIVGVTKEYLYYKIVEGVTSALARSTFFTWPSYWACVAYEDYETALDYVFGEEGSELRQQYAGLIEKTDRYNEEIKKNSYDILADAKNKGVNMCVLAKYGRQIGPICESCDEVADEFVTLTKASFGATTSTIYDTLSDEYIAQAEKNGKGKYISPDKQVDASTCLFPDYTWFFKGVSHMDYSDFEDGILFTVASAKRQLTVDDLTCSQFIIGNVNAEETEKIGWTCYDFEDMTEENCHNEAWKAETEIDKPEDKDGRLISFLVSLIRWFTDLFDLIADKISSK